MTELDNLIKAAEAVLLEVEDQPLTRSDLYALRQAVEQAKGVSVEPVAWLNLINLKVGGMAYATSIRATPEQTQLYTTPPSIDALIAELKNWYQTAGSPSPLKFNDILNKYSGVKNELATD